MSKIANPVFHKLIMHAEKKIGRNTKEAVIEPDFLYQSRFFTLASSRRLSPRHQDENKDKSRAPKTQKRGVIEQGYKIYGGLYQDARWCPAKQYTAR